MSSVVPWVFFVQERHKLIHPFTGKGAYFKNRSRSGHLKQLAALLHPFRGHKIDLSDDAGDGNGERRITYQL